MNASNKLKQKIRNKTAKICIIGLGYVGLPTAVLFAEKGFTVMGADTNKEKVNIINEAKSPLRDIDIEKKLNLVVRNKRLTAYTDVSKAVSKSDIILITVPTPVNAAKIPDLSFVESASEFIAKGVKRGQLIVLESTTFPGTTEEVVKPIVEKSGLKAVKDFGLAYCPERYTPSDLEHTIDNIERIVGGITPEWGEVARELYQAVIKKKITLVRDLKTAEAAKVIENIQRDLNIALMNELALIFDRMNIDVIEVINAASTKWNFIKLYPGPGVGGHCLPVDPYYLTHKAQELGYHPRVILAGRAINDSMPFHTVNMVIDGLNSVNKPVRGSKIAILGVAYKGNSGDLRESPGETIVEALKGMDANIFIHDPFINKKDCKKILKLNNNGLNEALSSADCVVIVTDHPQFKRLSINKLKSLVKENAVIVDSRHVFKPKDITTNGLIYRSIGRRINSNAKVQ
jgi:nucleotide sugar dehydrogenase